MTGSIDDTLKRFRVLETAANRAWWDAAVSGDADDYARVEDLRNRIDALLREPERFDAIASAKESGSGDPLEARVIELLYLEALPRQVEPGLSERINALSTEIERAFSTYRPVVEGERRSANDLEETLKESREEDVLRAAWEGLMSVGPLVDERLGELVRLRNAAAREVGFDDYYALRLALYEQDPDEVAAFFDRLVEATAAPFRGLKEEVDARLAERHGTAADALAPWHYQNPFFQEAPDVFGADLDRVYGGVDPLEVAAAYFDALGLPVDDILERSSLYEGEGKDPHAFAIDIDREGDVRILLNLRPNERWMGITLHELGHAVYDDGVSRELPWMVRRPAHTLTTEAIAMLLGRLPKRVEWMRARGVVDSGSAPGLAGPSARELRARMLIFSRWTQVMVRFERELYRDPDQDLNALWWDLKGRYQGLAPPDRADDAADYAAKIHIVVSPAYYHNYMLGECFASQLQARLRETLNGGDPLVRPEAAAGRWLAEHVFAPGARWHYDELARRVTGEAVGPHAFAEEFLAPVEA